MAAPLRVVVETGTKKVFASAADWPGWSRGGRDEEAALEALAAYEARYRPVVERAGVRLPKAAAGRIEVVTRVRGDSTTDFGVPATVTEVDHEPLTAAGSRRLAQLVEAAWAELDEIAAGAPATLRKGPRGGGRDRDAMLAHVVGAERAYGRKLGVRHPPFDPADRAARDAHRADLLAAIGGAHRASAPETPWPVRYGARRIAWHALDHAWEMEDRSEPAPEA